MRQDTDPGMHPSVHVALERNHHFRLSERALRRHSSRWLADVEATVSRRDGFDVVQDGVAVLDANLLIRHHAEYPRMIEAAVLVDFDVRRGRLIRCAVRQAAL